MNKIIEFLIYLVLVTGIAYGLHYFVLHMYDQDHWWIGTGYNLTSLYLYGSISSLVILFILVGADFAMPKHLGFIFLGCVGLKAIAGYIFIQSGLNLLENNFIELNFLGVFFLYMFFDVYIAFRLVNKEINLVEK
ncbi:hypothetical protein [Sphingobacterium humi]|uniref:Uncharacterized protein n=1 Tax=Sphingobacterium humi TaxID=1796905 RepID=A0A6N8KZI1_9SPHI|nr:hypothetical protein [Sphingobacterium humi]MVZ62234.1 hypothetical protein [Sphingobacterium humi]